MILLQEMNGGIVFSAELAVKIAEALCEAHHGKLELERQRPFVATDKGDTWRIEGSFNRDRKIEGRGAFFASIQKRDGRLTDLGTVAVIHQVPAIRSPIEQHIEGKKQRDGQ